MKKERILRIIALILCLAMMMCMLTACKEEIIEPENEDEETEEKDEFKMLYENFEPDEPVMKIGDVEFDWGTLYYYFYQEATQLYANMGEIYDWTAMYQNNQTYIEYCVSEAIYNYLRHIAGVEHFAEEYNVTLTDEQIKEIEENKAYDESLFGDAEAMQEYMDNMYLDEETSQYIAEIQYMYQNVMDAVVGEEGSKLTVEEIRALADTAYKAIKFVAIPKTAENAKANAEAALAEVKVSANPEAKLDELIDKYCEAEKAEEYKAGYVFTRGYFDDEAVEDALRELEIGEIYGAVVEGTDYYYVLMRTAVNVDAHPYYGAGADTEEERYGEYSLRVLYSDDIFEKMFWDWADNAEITFYENIENMDIYEVLGWY